MNAVVDADPQTPAEENHDKPSHHIRLKTIVAAVATAALLIGAGTVGGLLRGSSESAPLPVAGSSVESLTSYLAAVPGDWGSWSRLGQAQLERGRVTADPVWYAKAEESFVRSRDLQPDGNSPAIAGLAALSAARHDFTAAERGASAALAINPLDPGALGTLTDALTELGRYPAALNAANRLDASHPGVSSFTRLAYQQELRGDVDGALALLGRSADDAATPDQVAYARYQEGILALNAGRTEQAREALRIGSAMAPGDTTLLHLRARLTAVSGKPNQAAGLYRALIERRPAAAYALEAADFFTAAGDRKAAAGMVALARAQALLGRANGVAIEPADVLLEARHGDATRAVELGRKVWSAQRGVFAADALAVALHTAGQNAEALGYADRAVALGTAAPQLRAHRAAIVAALGRATSEAQGISATRPLTSLAGTTP